MNEDGRENKRSSVDRWLRKTKNLPTVPTVAQAALALLEDERSGALDLARVISRDEAMAAKVLRVVNSAFFGLAQLPQFGFEMSFSRVFSRSERG